MSNFLNPENSVMQFLARVCDYLILNVVFILSCIPIFTVGAALSALYTVSFKMIRKEDGYVLKRYFKAFCANFKQGTILWLICLILFFFLQYDGLMHAGENLGMKDDSLAGIPERLAEIQMEAWAASEGHKENIMQPDYNSIGTGIAQDKYGMYYLVQLFAGGNYSITGIDDPFLP